MIVLLLTLLVLALSMIFAGLWLSSKKQPPVPRRISHPGQIGMRPTRYVGNSRRARVRRSQVERERRAWNNIMASLNVGRLFVLRGRGGTPWLGLTLVLLALFLFGVYFLRMVFPNPAFFAFVPDATGNAAGASAGGTSTSPVLVPFTGASKALVRISQVDPAEYASLQEYNAWWPSTCSAAAMTEVINAYGHHYRLTDILSVEEGLGEISTSAGLLHSNGLDRTLARFNFTTRWLNHPSIDELINTANSGTPVIINFPPDRWPGGHLLVALGGNKNYVYLADSSSLDMRAMDRKTFLKYWVGFAVVATPAQQN